MTHTFELKPVSPFRLDMTVWTLRRRPHNVVDRWDGTTYRRVLSLPAGPVEAAVTQPASSETARLQVAVAGQSIRAAGEEDIGEVATAMREDPTGANLRESTERWRGENGHEMN